MLAAANTPLSRFTLALKEVPDCFDVLKQVGGVSWRWRRWAVGMSSRCGEKGDWDDRVVRELSPSVPK